MSGSVLEVERHELAVGAGAPANADAALERHERRRVLGARPVEVRSRLPTEVEDVLEALVRDERRARAAALEQRVRRDRRAVREAVDAAPHRPRPPRRSTDSCCRAAVGTFAIRTSPSSTSTASVKVPPTSIPSARIGVDSRSIAARE